MRITTAFLFYLLFPTLGFSQITLDWQKCFGGPNNDKATELIQTSDQGFLLVGTTYSDSGMVGFNHDTSGMSPDIWVVKLDSGYQVEWERSLGGSKTDEPASVYETFDHGFVITGFTNSKDGDISFYYDTLGVTTDIWVVKLSFNGGILWQKSLGGSLDDKGREVIQVQDSNFLILGTTASINGDVSYNHDALGGGNDVWFLKLDTVGNILWEKTFGGSNSFGDIGIDVNVINGDSMLILASTSSNNGDMENDMAHPGTFDIWVSLLDSAGNLLADTCLGGSDSDYPSKTLVTSDSTFILAGNTMSTDGDVVGGSGNIREDFWVISMELSGDSSFVVLNQNCIGNQNGNEILRDIALSPAGTYALTGENNVNGGEVNGNHGMKDMWWLELDTALQVLNKKSFGGTQNEIGSVVIPKNDGAFLLAGYTESTDGNASGGQGMADFWLLQLSIFTGETHLKSQASHGISVFPNPGSGQFKLALDMPEGSIKNKTSIEVYDMLGREIFQLNASLYPEGFISVDLTNQPQGCYFIVCRNEIESKGCMVVKE